MHRSQPVDVGLGREARHRPGHLAQEADDGGDVEELDAQRARLQVDHLEAGRLCRGAGALGAPDGVDRLRAHHEVDQLPVGPGPDLL